MTLIHHFTCITTSRFMLCDTTLNSWRESIDWSCNTHSQDARSRTPDRNDGSPISSGIRAPPHPCGTFVRVSSHLQLSLPTTLRSSRPRWVIRVALAIDLMRVISSFPILIRSLHEEHMALSSLFRLLGLFTTSLVHGAAVTSWLYYISTLPRVYCFSCKQMLWQHGQASS